MRYNQLLAEQTLTDLEGDWEADPELVWKQIEKDCSQILSLYRKYKTVLLRGTFTHSTFFRAASPKNRKPLDTPLVIQKSIDKWLAQNGFKALRKNSIFTTRIPIVAAEYGYPYVIFPINGFNYTWFAKTADLYHTVKDLWASDSVPASFADIEYIMDQAGPQNNTGIERVLSEEFRGDREVMINGTYYAFGIKSYSVIKPLEGFLGFKPVETKAFK